MTPQQAMTDGLCKEQGCGGLMLNLNNEYVCSSCGVVQA
jgi:hypothetical protein